MDPRRGRWRGAQPEEEPCRAAVPTSAIRPQGPAQPLSVHSASRGAAASRADAMVVQNLTVTLELALLPGLAFALRRSREVHGAPLLGTALLFMGIAVFFTLIAFVPGHRIEGPATFHRFGDAARAVTLAGMTVGLRFCPRNRRCGWPWLLAGAFFPFNAVPQVVVARNDATHALMQGVAAIDPAAARTPGILERTRMIALNGASDRGRHRAVRSPSHGVRVSG